MSGPNSQPEFKFKLPERLPEMSDNSYTAFILGALTTRLKMEKRTLVNNPDGRAENVAEHAFMLSVVAPQLAELLYPDLDVNLVARYGIVHDMAEAYVGDTPTYDIDANGLQAKYDLEAIGLAKLLADYSSIPSFVKLVKDYEDQIIPEARFVRVADKLMPLVVHFCDQGVTLRSYITPEGLQANADYQSALLRSHYPEFGKLIDVRDELSSLLAANMWPKE